MLHTLHDTWAKNCRLLTMAFPGRVRTEKEEKLRRRGMCWDRIWRMEVGGLGGQKRARLPPGRNSLLILLLAALAAQAETQVSSIVIFSSSQVQSLPFPQSSFISRHHCISPHSLFLPPTFPPDFSSFAQQLFTLCFNLTSLRALQFLIPLPLSGAKRWTRFRSQTTRVVGSEQSTTCCCKALHVKGKLSSLSLLTNNSLIYNTSCSGAAELQGNRKSCSRDSLDEGWGEDRWQRGTEAGLLQLLQGKTPLAMYYKII